jgi:FkbH-like protein
VAALDLDNTLWGGVVGEVGPLDVALGESADGEAFRAFQTYLSGLADRGVVLAVTSKNNPDDAKEPFAKNPNMVLRMEQIAAFEANWEAKSHSLARIADALRLGLDAFVFVDDSPVEREQVRAALPEVTVLEVSDEPADLAFRLSSSLLFESASVTEADRERAEQYRVEQLRDAVQRSFDTLDDYLRSLEHRGRARPVADHDMLRVAQLVAKTNQFNLTTRRHDRETLERMCKTPDAICLSLHLADRFGDYGLIGLLLAVPRSARALEIDTWLMSCRALGRTAEHYLFRELLGLARATGVERLSGSFLPTKKNAQVASLLPSLGFSEVRRDDDGSRHFELSMRDAEAPKTFVTKWD